MEKGEQELRENTGREKTGYKQRSLKGRKQRN